MVDPYTKKHIQYCHFLAKYDIAITEHNSSLSIRKWVYVIKTLNINPNTHKLTIKSCSELSIWHMFPI